MEQETLGQDETYSLIAADKVQGTAVYDGDANKLGSIHNVMIDKRTGRVVYAVMSFGGFLGIGERYHPLPWQVLHYDTGLGGYVVNLSRDQLEHAPHYAADELRDFEDRAWGEKVRDYYGVGQLGPVRP